MSMHFQAKYVVFQIINHYKLFFIPSIKLNELHIYIIHVFTDLLMWKISELIIFFFFLSGHSGNFHLDFYADSCIFSYLMPLMTICNMVK